MPVYEYACKSCGEHLEVAQSFKDDPLTTCPACGGPLRKVFGSIGITFKGSGFYRTDSRSASTNGAKGDKKKEKAATGSDTSSSDVSTGSAEPSKGSGEASGGSSSGGKDASASKAKAASA